MESAWESAALLLGNTLDPALRATTQFIAHLSKPVSAIILRFEDFRDSMGAMAAGLAALFTGDLEGMEAIKEARNEQAAATEAQIARIWEEGTATKQLTEDVKTLKDAVGDGVKIIPDAPEDGEDTAGATKMLPGGVDITAIQEGLMAKQELLREDHERDVFQVEQWISESFDREEEGEALIFKMKQKYAKDTLALKRKEKSSNIATTGQMFGALAGLAATFGKKAFGASKQLATAETIVKTYSAAQKAYDNAGGGYPGAAAAAVAIIAGYTRVRQIQSTDITSTGVASQSADGSPSGLPQDSISGGYAPQQREQDRLPTTININIEGAKDTEEIVEEIRELFSDGMRQFA